MSRLNYTLPDEYHGRELEGYVEKVDSTRELFRCISWR